MRFSKCLVARLRRAHENLQRGGVIVYSRVGGVYPGDHDRLVRVRMFGKRTRRWIRVVRRRPPTKIHRRIKIRFRSRFTKERSPRIATPIQCWDFPNTTLWSVGGRKYGRRGSHSREHAPEFEPKATRAAREDDPRRALACAQRATRFVPDGNCADS